MLLASVGVSRASSNILCNSFQLLFLRCQKQIKPEGRNKKKSWNTYRLTNGIAEAILNFWWRLCQLESAYLMSREQMKYCYQVVLQTAVSKLVLHIDTTSNSSHGGERTRFSWCSVFPNSQLVVFFSWKQYNPPTVSISTRGHVKIVFQSWNQIKWMYASVWENVPFLENSFLLFLSWRLLSCNFCNIYIVIKAQ